MQAPFISVWMYIDPNDDPKTQSNTTLLIEEMLKQRIEGMKSPDGRIINPTFPKLLYGLDENNIKENSPYYYLTELAAKCTAQRMVPDYISVKKMKEIKNGGIYPPMGCRSMLTPYKDENNEFKAWGRLNLGVISLNIPYVALESKTQEEFFEKLVKYATIICEEQLKFCERICNSPTARAPMLWNYGVISRLPKDAKIGDLLKTHKGYATVSLGYTGIAEATYRFGIEYVSEDGHKFAEKILKTLTTVIDKYRQNSPFDFSLYGTPQQLGAFI